MKTLVLFTAVLAVIALAADDRVRIDFYSESM
jgi:hypothetical protein